MASWEPAIGLDYTSNQLLEGVRGCFNNNSSQVPPISSAEWHCVVLVGPIPTHHLAANAVEVTACGVFHTLKKWKDVEKLTSMAKEEEEEKKEERGYQVVCAIEYSDK